MRRRAAFYNKTFPSYDSFSRISSAAFWAKEIQMNKDLKQIFGTN